MKQLIDFDGLFDKKLTKFMEENKDKYTEKQWEDIIPGLYKKFGDTYVAKVKCTPKEYYARMSETELVETLSAHLEADVPIPEFLCAEIENRGEKQAMLSLLYGENAQAATYALNMLGDDSEAFEAYFDILVRNRFDEDIRSDVTDILRAHADEIKDRAYTLYKQGVAKDYALEILSRVKDREERVYEALVASFRSGENIPVHAGYLAAYGDERALPILLERIEDTTIGFVEFQELKYAIEALGGEYDEPRDFTGDKDYVAVEAAASKTATDKTE